jgi:hypothetical protein
MKIPGLCKNDKQEQIKTKTKQKKNAKMVSVGQNPGTPTKNY